MEPMPNQSAREKADCLLKRYLVCFEGSSDSCEDSNERDANSQECEAIESKLQELGFLVRYDRKADTFYLSAQSGAVKLARQLCATCGITMTEYDRNSTAFDKSMDIARWKKQGWL